MNFCTSQVQEFTFWSESFPVLDQGRKVKRRCSSREVVDKRTWHQNALNFATCWFQTSSSNHCHSLWRSLSTSRSSSLSFKRLILTMSGQSAPSPVQRTASSGPNGLPPTPTTAPLVNSVISGNVSGPAVGQSAGGGTQPMSQQNLNQIVSMISFPFAP